MVGKQQDSYVDSDSVPSDVEAEVYREAYNNDISEYALGSTEMLNTKEQKPGEDQEGICTPPEEPKSQEHDGNPWIVDYDDIRKGPKPTRYYDEKGLTVRCYNCKELGHFKLDCSKIDLSDRCRGCGAFKENHICIFDVCFNCGATDHYKKDCPEPDMTCIVCPRCLTTGHKEEWCPDRWRQYHNTITYTAPVPAVLPTRQPSCYNCGEPGHYGTACEAKSEDRYREVDRSCVGPLNVLYYDNDTSALSRSIRKRKVKLDKSIQNGYSDTIVSDGSAKTSSKKHRPKSATDKTHGKKTGQQKRRSKSFDGSYEAKLTEEKGTLTKSRSVQSLYNLHRNKCKHPSKKKLHSSNTAVDKTDIIKETNDSISRMNQSSCAISHANQPRRGAAQAKEHPCSQGKHQNRQKLNNLQGKNIHQQSMFRNKYEEALNYNHAAIYRNLPAYHPNVFHVIPYRNYSLETINKPPPTLNPTPEETRGMLLQKKKKKKSFNNNPMNNGNNQCYYRRHQDQNKFRTNNCNFEPRVRQKSGENFTPNNNFYRAEHPRHKPTKAKLNDFISNNKPPKQKKKNRKNNNSGNSGKS